MRIPSLPVRALPALAVAASLLMAGDSIAVGHRKILIENFTSSG